MVIGAIHLSIWILYGLFMASGLRAVQPTVSDNEPTLRKGEVYLAHQSPKYQNKIKKGDLVVYKIKEERTNPSKLLKGHDEKYIKRVVGIPGDTISQKGKSLKINGQEVSSPTGIVTSSKIFFATHRNVDITLKDNEFFLIGDNHSISLDSRHIGVIYRSEILGVILLED